VSDRARRTILGNGLTVITKEMRLLPITSFWVWYRVGSRNESAGTTGISHWVEHMMFQGTPSIGKGEIFRMVSANGGMLNGFTWLDYTAYFETLPSHRLDLAISIESDRMVNSLFLPDEVERERTVIISEREGSENNPSFLLGEEIGATAFMAHPYGHSVIGWKSDLQSMTRDDLYDHYRTYYSPNNAIVVAVGDFDTDHLLRQIDERFGQIPSGPPVPPVRTSEPPQRGERRITMRYPAGAPQFDVAYHAPAVSDPDVFPMLVLDAVLSGGKPMGMFGSRGARMGRSSRLYRALVDAGLASSASSSFALTRDPYLFEIEVTPRPDVSLQQVEEVVFREVERIQADGVERDEMDRALKQVRAQLVYGSESVTDQGYWLGAMEAIDSFESYERLLERLTAVAPEDVQRVAGRYLTETNRTVGWLIPTQTAGSSQAAAATVAVARPFYYRAPRGDDPQDPLAASDRLVAEAGGGAPAARVRLAIDRREMGNGPVVLTTRYANSPQVVVRASVLAGSVFDPADKVGLARFTGPMVIRGTRERGFQAISEETDRLGMALNVETGRLTSQVSIRCLKEDLPRAMEILAEVLRGPSFPAEEVEKLRAQIITALREQETMPRVVAERRFLEEIYPPGHPYRLWPSGTVESVAGISRDDLLSFYQRHFRPDQLTLAVVGDLSPEEALDQAHRVLGDWQAEGEKPPMEIPAVGLPPASVREVEVPGKFQSELVMGLPALSRLDPDYYALRLGNLILGELGLAGRLGAVIRDQMGLAYHVSSELQASIGPSPWAVRAGVNPANVDRAIDAARREIERWREELVTDEELGDGKSFLIGSLPLALEASDGLAHMLLDIEFYRLGLDYLDRYPRLIASITSEQIRDAVRKWIHPDHLVTVVAGPKRH